MFVAGDGFDFNEVAVEGEEWALLGEVVERELRVVELLLQKGKGGEGEC